MIAKIAVSGLPFAIDKPYSYFLPAGMLLQPGCRVIVPFGRSNKRVEGMVLSLEEGSSEGLKSVERVLYDCPVLSATGLRLAAFLRERCFCAYYECLHAMLPAGLWFHTRETFTLTEPDAWKTAVIRQPDARKVLQALEDLGGSAELGALRRYVGDERALSSARVYLKKKKWVEGDTDFLRNATDKSEKIATLAASAEETMEFAASRPRSASAQRAVLQALCAVGSASVKELCYYTGATGATVRRLAELGYLTLEERPRLRCRDSRPAAISGELRLNEAQSAAFTGLKAQMESPAPGAALLYGVTGSGKTAVYLKLIQSCLEVGRSAIFLVPEIGLTPQLLSLLAAYFGDKVAVQHSSLSAAERYDQFRRIRSGDATVVVGTRSAVFAPAVRPGLLILDEEQEHSYRSENSPRYDAREVARWRGIKEHFLVLFGSATPSVETMYRAKTGEFSLFSLPGRYNGRALPEVSLVDLREEIREGNDLSISRMLAAEIEDNRRRGEQTILFLNRRGNSRALVCVQCGSAPECPRCAERLVYHSANERVMCHHCGFSQPAPKRCPRCGGALKRIGLGTQKVQLELESLFPNMQIARMDADTVNTVNTHEKILTRFKEEEIPVLLGTQMVAKGLNLPKVSLVGVLDADLGLYATGYRAAEETFNMLTQVVGRAGRGDTPGRAVIQTMAPDHPGLIPAAKQDYDGFYQLEIEMRRVQQAPPFGSIAAVVFTGRDEGAAFRAAARFRDSLAASLRVPEYADVQCAVLGPAPCAVPKINLRFRWRLTLHGTFNRKIRLLLAQLLRQSAQNKENRGVCAIIDAKGDPA